MGCVLDSKDEKDRVYALQVFIRYLWEDTGTCFFITYPLFSDLLEVIVNDSMTETIGCFLTCEIHFGKSSDLLEQLKMRFRERPL